ncbi:MAG: ankyrin repeat domain-containing protein [Pyrinomonadaceae bacterium]
MLQIPRIFAVSLFVSLFIFYSAVVANAQAMSSYLFLEVTDSNQKPASNAKVETRLQSYSRPIPQQTDETGKFNAEYLDVGRPQLSSQFTITKTNYYPFYDFGNLQVAGGRQVKVELLKVPTNEKERKALGNEQFNRDFFAALQKQDVETVCKLLKSGINPNLAMKDLRGVSGYENIPAILFPVVQRNLLILQTLLKAGTDIRRQNEYLSNILFYYFQTNINTRSGETEAEKEKLLSEFDEGLNELIKTGADVNADTHGLTPLMLAVMDGYVQAVKILISAGANVNAKDASLGTALTIAKKYQGYGYNKIAYPEIIKLLEAAGAK